MWSRVDGRQAEAVGCGSVAGGASLLLTLVQHKVSMEQERKEKTDRQTQSTRQIEENRRDGVKLTEAETRKKHKEEGEEAGSR